MQISELTDLLPSPEPSMRPYSWTLYELGPGPNHDLLAVGTLENDDPNQRELYVRVLDLGSREPYNRLVMVGRGSRSHAGVKITPGDVLVRSISMRGRGVGTLVFNLVVGWAKRTFPGQQVAPITIIRPAGSVEFDQLSRFYGRFGMGFDRPEDGNWNQQFPSLPMKVDDLAQYPESELPHVRRVELPEALTLMFERLSGASDDRRLLTVFRQRQADQRVKWSMIGRRVNRAGLALAFVLGIGVARIYEAIM